MIKENIFFIKNLKNVVFLGEHGSLKELIDINKIYKLNSKVITSKNQSKSLKTQNIEHKVFNKLDKKYEKFISNEFNIKETLFLSIRSRWIFKKDKIKNFYKSNLVNYHPTRLPLYSGGADISWRIMAGDRIDCQTLHIIDQNIDSGPIIFFKKSILPENLKKPEDLINYSAKKIIYLYKDFIHRLKNNKHFNLQKQSHYLGKYHPRLLTKINGWIDWNIPSEKLINFINAFESPYRGASTMYKKKRIYLKNVQLHGAEFSGHPFMSGIVIRNEGKWIVVATSDDNFLVIQKVLNEKNENIIKTIKIGERFITSHKKLFISKSYRLKIGARGIKN